MPSRTPALPPARRRLFLAVALLLPWLLLLAAEGALRLGGYGSSYPLFTPHRGHPGWLAINPDVARRWFSGPFVPTPELELFRAARPRRGFRAFFQGESSAQGFPYGHGAMPSRMLAERLAATFPGREIEVVNTAFTAINSYALLDQADEIIAQRPDAVLLYTGHNEYYGALGAASTTALGGRTAARAALLVRRSRLAQLLAAGVARLRRPPARKGAAPRTVMELLAGDQRVPLGSARYQRGLEQFRANLADLLERYRAAGVPVFIGTVASNERDQPPLMGARPARASGMWASDYYAMARSAEARGDTAAARRAYREAKERDDLRFRAPEAINAIIRQEAARHGARVVETQRALAAASPNGVVGGAVMLEHLHPNLRGYEVIADAFYQALHAARMPEGWPLVLPPAGDVATTPLDSAAGALRADRLLSGWPFRPRGRERTPAVDTLHPRTQAERLARAVVLGQLPWPEATERLRAGAQAEGDYATALRASLALAQEYRHAPEGYVDAARAAAFQGRDDEAVRYAQLAMARRETAFTARLAGILALRKGDRVLALRLLRRASELAPSDRRMTVPYQAAVWLPSLEANVAEDPRDPASLYELAAAYAITEQADKARATLKKLMRVSPEHAAGRELLARVSPP